MLQAATGFGFSLVAAPLVFAALEAEPAVGLLLVLGLEVNLLTLVTEGRRPRPLRRSLLWMLVAGAPRAVLRGAGPWAAPGGGPPGAGGARRGRGAPPP